MLCLKCVPTWLGFVGVLSHFDCLLGPPQPSEQRSLVHLMFAPPAMHLSWQEGADVPLAS